MSGGDFKIIVQGPEAEKTAGELAGLIKEEFGHEPVMEKGTGVQPEPGKKIDPNLIAAGASVAAVILSIPSALLVARDFFPAPKRNNRLTCLSVGIKTGTAKIRT